MQVMERFPNVFCEIGPQMRFSSESLLSGSAQNWELDLIKSWQDAVVRHPKRVIWGSDVYQWSDLEKTSFDRYGKVMDLFCDPLPLDVREKLIGKN